MIEYIILAVAFLLSFSSFVCVNKKEFNTVVHNVATAVKYKRANNYQVTIGIQFLLLKENYEDVEKATVLAKEI